MDSRMIQISERGSFKGSAEIDIAEIRGSFDGNLTVRQKLVIYATGKVTGRIRYGKVVIEEGGQLSGEIEFGASASCRQHRASGAGQAAGRLTPAAASGAPARRSRGTGAAISYSRSHDRIPFPGRPATRGPSACRVPGRAGRHARLRRARRKLPRGARRLPRATRDDIRFIVNRQEGGAAFMAEAHRQAHRPARRVLRHARPGRHQRLDRRAHRVPGFHADGAVRRRRRQRPARPRGLPGGRLQRASSGRAPRAWPSASSASTTPTASPNTSRAPSPPR